MRYQAGFNELFLNRLFELERGDAGYMNSIVDEREGYISAAAHANVARKFGNVKYVDMNHIAGADGNIGDNRFRGVGKLLDPVVCLLRCFFLRLAVSGLQAQKGQEGPY